MFVRHFGVLALLVALPLTASEQMGIGYLSPSPQLFDGAITLSEPTETCIIWNGPHS